MKLVSKFIKLSKKKKVVLVFITLIFGVYSVPRIIATVRFSGAHQPSLESDFSQMPNLLPSGDSKFVDVRKGIEHNFFETSKFHTSLWLTPTSSYDGYFFDYSKLNTSSEFKKTAIEVLTSVDSFYPYGGPKLCGGFHADYMLTVIEEGEKYHFMVCFGCHEVLIYTPKGSRIVDLKKSAYDRLKASWEALE